MVNLYLNNYIKNQFFNPIQNYHNRFICSFDHLPEKGKVKEIALRIIILLSSPILYPLLGIIALVGLPFNTFFQPPTIIEKPKIITPEPPIITKEVLKIDAIDIPKQNFNYQNLSIACCSKRNIPQEIESKVSQPDFCSNVDNLFADGLLKSFEKTSPISLKYIPDNSPLITDKLRQKLGAHALLLAPNQPQNRAFEYVGFGSGFMRQDMHQVLCLLSKDYLQITDINISLVDPIYSPTSTYYDENSVDYLIEFAAILHLRAPHAKIALNLYSSTDELVQSNPQIDLLVAIRVENEQKNPEVQADLKSLSQHLAANSGYFVSDTSVQNKVQSYCMREGIRISDPESSEKGKELFFYAYSFSFQGYKGRKIT